MRAAPTTRSLATADLSHDEMYLLLRDSIVPRPVSEMLVRFCPLPETAPNWGRGTPCLLIGTAQGRANQFLGRILLR